MDETNSTEGQSWPDPRQFWQSWLRAFGLRAPLSGDVTQAIDPSLVRGIGDQLGFININTSGSGDPELERRIVEQVASYGRQLGRVLDALDVLIRRDERGQLGPEDQLALTELQRLRTKIAATKEHSAAEQIDRLVGQIHALQQDPAANDAALRRIRQALDNG